MTGNFDIPAPDMVKYPSVKGDISMYDSQKKANAKYRKEHERQYFFALNDRTRPLMLKYMDERDDKQAYIRHLIAADMKSQGLQTDGMDGE